MVESPTKAKTISRFLGNRFEILATKGHVRDLPKGKLGVDLEKEFEPEYVTVTGQGGTVSQLKKAVAVADQVYLATDLDREGEAIAYHVTAICRKGDQKKFKRITFHEITVSAIEKAIASPGKVNLQLVDAQQARRVLDRLVGYKLSPLLWRKIRRGLSAGRVQSVAVRLVVEREREIEKFKPEEFWEIFCRLAQEAGGKEAPVLMAKICRKNGKKIVLTSGVEATVAVEELKKAVWEVDRVEKKALTKTPPPPLITSTMQRQAFAKFHFSSKQTMRLAQALYEKGLITYHRTDSVFLAQEAVKAVREFIGREYGEKFLPSTERHYRVKSKLAQEAHEAIRPTKFVFPGEGEFGQPGERKLYELILKRAVGSQMASAIFDRTRLWAKAQGEKNTYLGLTEGEVVKFAGWLAAWGKGKGDEGITELPELNEGEKLRLEEVLPEQKFTQPPARYNEASLIKALEEKEIGRPSTYAPTISTIQLRQYVEKKENKFWATALGMTVNDFLVEHFGRIVDYDFTALMEDEFDEVAQGKKEWRKMIGEFYKPFAKILGKVEKMAQRVKVPVESLGEKCPQCKEGELVIRTGRFGKFVSCSRFPECDYRATYKEKVEGVRCPDCGGEIIVRRTRKGRVFYGCGNWPKCKWATWRKPKAEKTPVINENKEEEK